MGKVENLMGLGVPSQAATEFVSQDSVVLQSAVAATGSVISQALALTGDYIWIKSVSSGDNDGVQLRTATASDSRQVVVNASAVALKVYPPTGGWINNQTINTSYSLGSGLGATFAAVAASQYWKV